MRVTPIPLGASPISDFIPTAEAFQKTLGEPHFMEAWPIEITDGGDSETLYAYKNLPIVIAKRRGQGKLVVIGDSQFLHDRTLENERSAWPGNVGFVRRILS